MENIYKTGEGIYRESLGIEAGLKDVYESIDRLREINQVKVLEAMKEEGLTSQDLVGTTGYGYSDRGRDAIEGIYAKIFKAEDALVRSQIASGTHALTLSLFGNLRPGDEMLSITGKPYDTLEEVIGIRETGRGSLKEYMISYSQTELIPGGGFDYDRIEKAINERTKLVLIQRSGGYELRKSLTIEEIKGVCKFIKDIKSDVIIMVDNCYGEFTEGKEPSEAGADLVVGSLIKNPGGGIAPTGGYVAGKREIVENIAARLTAPGIGKDIGASLDINRLFLQGLFLAPHVVGESLKGAVFASAFMERWGFKSFPGPRDMRSDIIQTFVFETERALLLFCKGIQEASPVDSFVTPIPWDMPGYDAPVVMAQGGFVQGSSIELSADGPIKPPYIGFMQGGLVYEQVKMGIFNALQLMLKEGIINI